MTGPEAALTFPVSSTHAYPLWDGFAIFFGGKKEHSIIFEEEEEPNFHKLAGKRPRNAPRAHKEARVPVLLRLLRKLKISTRYKPLSPHDRRSIPDCRTHQTQPGALSIIIPAYYRSSGGKERGRARYLHGPRPLRLWWRISRRGSSWRQHKRLSPGRAVAFGKLSPTFPPP